MRSSATLVMFMVVAAGANLAQAQDNAAELKKLDGTYQMIRGEEGGKPLAEELVKNSKLTISGDKHVVQLGTETLTGTHTVNPLEKPKSIDATDSTGRFAGKTVKGIYRLDGDDFTVSFAPPGEPRPQQFMTQDKPGRLLHVWKRVE